MVSSWQVSASVQCWEALSFGMPCVARALLVLTGELQYNPKHSLGFLSGGGTPCPPSLLGFIRSPRIPNEGPDAEGLGDTPRSFPSRRPTDRVVVVKTDLLLFGTVVDIFSIENCERKFVQGWKTGLEPHLLGSRVRTYVLGCGSSISPRLLLRC